MKRSEFKEELDKIYSQIEEAEDEIRRNIRQIENARDELGSLAELLTDEALEEEPKDEGNDQENSER